MGILAQVPQNRHLCTAQKKNRSRQMRAFGTRTGQRPKKGKQADGMLVELKSRSQSAQWDVRLAVPCRELLAM